jgi:O-methyltransferase
MTSVEQRINLFHLCNQVLAYNVPGDIVELGTSRGQTAVIYAKLLEKYGAKNQLHLFDAWPNPGTIEAIRFNFLEAEAQPPILHRGLFEATIPAELPEAICLASIDLGAGMAPDLKTNVLFCLEHIYPRLSPGGICVLQSYCDPAVHPNLAPYHRPQVKAAADEFLKDKKESMSVMYSGRFHVFAHAYFRKGDPN